jgi:hypothetical protein
MKVTLDLTDLVQRGEISADEAKRLAGLAARETGVLGSNILLGFGTIAVAAGAGFLLPSAATAVIGGVILLAGGLAVMASQATRWTLFAQFCVSVGALAIAGGSMFLWDGAVWVSLGLAVVLAIAAVASRSGLLAALAVLELGAVLGAATAYWQASYFFGVERPALTIAVMGLLAVGLVLLSTRQPRHERICLIAARTAVLVVNLAFLVGSLFGDSLLNWPAGAFSIVWAVLLVGVGAWGVWSGRRWVVNAAAIFGGVHFYTQWFEYLGATPLSVLVGGVLLIGFGLVLRRFNAPPAGQAVAA